MAAKRGKAGKDPIKVGIIGLGRAGFGMHCKELEPRQKSFSIVAGCDPLASKRKRFAAQVPKAACYRTAAELIADPEVDLIDIANRNRDHVVTVLQALASGKDVFLEKPICETYEEACRIRRAATKAKGSLYIRHNRRFEATFVHIQELIARGILGDVYEIKLARHSYSRRDDWQTIKSCGGGQLTNWGPHIIDHALRFLESPVKEIWSDLKRIAAVGDAEDHLKVILKGRNNRIVDLEISGGVAISSPVYAVYGTRGSLVSQDEQTITLRYLDPRKKLPARKASKGDPGSGGFGAPDVLKWIEKEIPVKPKRKTDPACIWDHLYAAMREDTPFPITLDQAVEVMRIVSEVKKGTPFVKRRS
ncbi:MAG: Gfo/Idh/MocA family oxidoreductase [Lentisphaerae bacterium]|nr:Gfo/Idh/MocA family oxidoreductase [Lentisphaerota bacterium]